MVHIADGVSLIVLMLATIGRPGQDAGPACAFAVARAAAPAVITGPAAVTKMARVMDQPDSPLRIVRMDLSAAMFGKTGAGIVIIDVMNTSDRPIRGGAVRLVWRATQGDVPEISGTVRFTNFVMPGEVTRVGGEFADDFAFDMTTTAVVASVQSVAFEHCTYEPAQMATRASATQESGTDTGSASGACAFTAGIDATSPAIVGPADVVSRMRVGPQPGSPLRIIRIDVSHLRLNVGDTWVQARGACTIEVQNVSDRAIEDADIRLFTGATRVEGIDVAWNGTLNPGKSLALRASKVATIVDIPGGTTAADFTLLAIVDRARFASCDYRPARGYPVDKGPARQRD